MEREREKGELKTVPSILPAVTVMGGGFRREGTFPLRVGSMVGRRGFGIFPVAIRRLQESPPGAPHAENNMTGRSWPAEHKQEKTKALSATFSSPSSRYLHKKSSKKGS